MLAAGEIRLPFNISHRKSVWQYVGRSRPPSKLTAVFTTLSVGGRPAMAANWRSFSRKGRLARISLLVEPCLTALPVLQTFSEKGSTEKVPKDKSAQVRMTRAQARKIARDVIGVQNLNDLVAKELVGWGWSKPMQVSLGQGRGSNGVDSAFLKALGHVDERHCWRQGPNEVRKGIQWTSSQNLSLDIVESMTFTSRPVEWLLKS